MSTKLVFIAVVVGAIMLRLGLMRAATLAAGKHSEKADGVSARFCLTDQCFLFFLLVVINAFGYGCQGVLEYILGISSNVSQKLPNEVAGYVLTSVIPGSAAGYAVLSTTGFGSKWIRGSSAAFATQTLLDLYITATGAIPLRAFAFCVGCNCLGAPIGVFLALVGYKAICGLRSSPKA